VKSLSKNNNPNCPFCNNNLEHGYIGSESLISGIKWFEKKKLSGLGGKIIKDPGLTGMVYIEAYRCTKCKKIIFDY